jgi:hypothetical protein
VDPVLARIVAACDAGLADKRARRDEAEEAQWAAECSGDEIIILARRLERAWDRGQKEKPRGFDTPEDAEIAAEEAQEYAETLFALAQAIERSEGYRAAEAAGFPHRKAIIRGPRVRNVAASQRDSKPADGEPAKKLTRTEQWLLQQEARQGPMPQRPAPVVPQPADMGWHRGTEL